MPHHALSRAALSGAAGLLVALLLRLLLSWRLAAYAGWNAGLLALLVLAWLHIWKRNAAATRAHAAAEDPGRAAVTLVVLLAAASSLLSTVALLHRAKAVAGTEGDVLVALCLVNVSLCWAVAHTAFALRYAHLYYREDEEGVGGVEFPGTEAPCYFDFAYLAFTIGMCFQVSDSSVSSPQIRRAVLLQALLAFVFNTAILAFALNFIFGLAS